MAEKTKVVTHAVSKKGVVYHTTIMKHVKVRHVWKNQEETGEFHITSDTVDDNKLIEYLLEKLPDNTPEGTVGLVDKDGIFNFDYNVYVNTTNVMIILSMFDIIDEIDNKIEGSL